LAKCYRSGTSAEIESAVHEFNSKGWTVPLQKFIDCQKDCRPCFKQEEILDHPRRV